MSKITEAKRENFVKCPNCFIGIDIYEQNEKFKADFIKGVVEEIEAIRLPVYMVGTDYGNGYEQAISDIKSKLLEGVKL